MTINYQIWLTWNAEKEKMRLPVLPEKFDVKNGSNNRSVDLTGLGEVTIMQSRPALQFSFSSFFPAHGFPGMKSLIAVPPILYATVIAFIANETLSIIENAGLMGVPIPKALTGAIEILKQKSEQDNMEE